MFARKVVFAVVAVALLAAAGPVQAQNNYFQNGGNYNSIGNWVARHVPAGADVGVISNGLIALLSSNVSASVPTQLNIGDGTDAGFIGSGELDLTDGAVLNINPTTTTGTLYIGEGAAGTFQMTTAGGAAPSLTLGSNLYVGDTGTGTFNMNGGNVNLGGYLMIGYGTGTTGNSFTMTGGSVSVETTVGGNHLFVGYNSPGTYHQSGGTTSVYGNNNLVVGGQAAGAGTVTLDGTATLNTNQLWLGYQSTATSVVNLGGSATLNSVGNVYIGFNNAKVLGSGNCTFNVTGGTINMTGGTIHVGVFGQGFYNQSGGTVNAGLAGFDLGQYTQAGNGGTATLSGGVLNTPSFRDGAGATTAVNSLFTQTGGTLNITGPLGIAGNATYPGVFQLSGGLVQMSGGGPVSGVTFQFAGGTLSNAGSISTNIDLSGTTAVINNVTFNGTISGTISGSGAGFTKTGVGGLTLTAANTYTGPTVVQGGQLTLANATPFAAGAPNAISVLAGATLGTSVVTDAFSNVLPVAANANVTFSDKSGLAIAGNALGFSTLGIQQLSSVTSADKVLVNLSGLTSGGSAALLTYTGKGAHVPHFVTQFDSVGTLDYSIIDDGVSTVTATATNMASSRGFLGQDEGGTPNQYWTQSAWLENGTYAVSYPNSTTAKAWFNDNVTPLSSNCILDANVTLSSMLFNGSYTISKLSLGATETITLNSSSAARTQIQVIAGTSSIAPDMKFAASGPVIQAAANASLTLSGKLSDMTAGQAAGFSIVGGTAGTTDVLGAVYMPNAGSSYTGPVSVTNATWSTGYFPSLITLVNGGFVYSGSTNKTLTGALSVAGAANSLGASGSGALTLDMANSAISLGNGTLTKIGAGNLIMTNSVAGTTVAPVGGLVVVAGSLSLQSSTPTTFTVLNSLNVGYTNPGTTTGEFDVSGSPTLTVGGSISVGTGAPGALSMTAGTVSSATNMYIGYNAVGTFNMTGGTINDGGYFMVGYQTGAGGSTATISGGVIHATGGGVYAGWTDTGSITMTGGKVTATNAVFVGGAASGTFYQSGGAITSWGVGGNGDFILGDAAGTQGVGSTATITGTAILTANKMSPGFASTAPVTLNIGDAPGTLPANATANNPTVNLNSNLYLGYNSPQTDPTAGAATLNFTGGTININAPSIVHVGVFGQGIYNQTGGTLNCNTGGFDIGHYNVALGANGGTAVISGGVINTPQLRDGDNASDTASFTQTGGTVNVYGTTAAGITSISTIPGVYNLSGGLLDMTCRTFTTQHITDPNGVGQDVPVLGPVTGTGGTVSGVNFQFTGGTLSNAASVTTGITLSGTAAVVSNDVGLGGAISGVMSGTGGFAKAGAGALVLTAANTYTGLTKVKTGTLQLSAPAFDAVLNTTGTARGADIQGGQLVFDYSAGSDPVATVRANLHTSFVAGSGKLQSGPMFTSTGSALGYGIGYSDDATAKTVTAKVAVYGDATLDGVTDISDLSVLASHWNQTSGQTWATGDFNYDGAVNISDLSLLAANWNRTLTGISLGGAMASAGLGGTVPVPEPGTLLLLAGGLISLLAYGWGRRR